MSGISSTSGSKSLQFSTKRHGGVSDPPFHSLNLSHGVGDKQEMVHRNRSRLKKKYSIPILLSARQVHGDKIFIADHPLLNDLEVDGYDALLTNISGIGLLIQQADCQGISLFDPVACAVACVHSGWKGSVLNILAKTVFAMKRHYNSDPADLHAIISPSLGPCCAEFKNHPQELPSSFLAFQVKENYFDFWQVSKMQLLEAGLRDENIVITGICTSCSPEFFSYRRACRAGDGKTGRGGTVIALR